MKVSYINWGDIDIKFCCSFFNGGKISHENLCSPFLLQQYVTENECLRVEELLKRYEEEGYNIDISKNDNEKICFIDCWDRLRGTNRGNYFRYRFLTESYLSGIHLLKLIGRGSLVDVGCGTGHFSSLYKHYCSSTVAIDAELSNLLILHKFFSKNTHLICTDLNVTLGLDDEKYDNFFMSDLFHYVRNKEHFISEIDKHWSKKGLLLFNHIHHCGQYMQEKGIGNPLSLSGLRNLLSEKFPDAQICFFGERDFVRFVLGKSDRLTEAKEDEKSPLVCIVSYQNYDLKKKLPTPPAVKLNNAYDLVVSNGGLTLERCELSQEFLTEFKSDLFPEKCEFFHLTIPYEDWFSRGLLVPR